MNRHRIRIVATVLATGVAALFLVVASAAPALADPSVSPVILAVDDLQTVIANLTGWITGIIAAIATLFLTIGGTRYLMAGGDPSEVERAKGALKSAGIGYGLALLAPIIVGVLNQALGV